MAKKQNDKITYKKLLEFLLTLNEEQLECDVTVHDTNIDEYFIGINLCINEEDDVLDAGHPYIEVF